MDTPNAPEQYTWILDRSSNLFNAITPDGHTLTLSLEDLSDNRYTLIGRQVRSKETGRVVWNIPQDREFRVVPTTSGPTIFANEVPPEQQSGVSPNASTYALSLNTEIQMPNGEARSLDLNYLSLTPINRLVMHNPDLPPKRGFLDVPAGENQQRIINDLVTQGFHLATTTELLEHAISGYLIRKQRDLLTELINLGATDENGNELLDEYDAAGFIARIVASGATTYEIGW